MPADANIFQEYLKAPKSVMDYQTQYDEADTRKNALQQSVLALQKGQMDMANAADVSRQRNALRAAIGNGQIDLSNPAHTSAALSLAPDVAPALLETVQKSATARAAATKDTAQAGEADAKTAASKLDQSIKAHDFHVQQLGAVNDPQTAQQWAIQGLQSGVFTPEQFQAGYARIPTDPAGFAQWKQAAMQGGVNATEQLKMKQAQLIADNSNATSRANNKDTNDTHVRTTAMTNKTSRDNNAATIAKDYNVAGLNPDGTPGTANDSMVDAIGQYKVAPPNGMALRNPRMQQILADVTAKYPDFDATQYGARQGAAKSFSTGKDAQNVQAANTALNHLDTIEQLATAQKNGNFPLFNKIANTIAAQTGQPAPTSLAAAVSMVAPELTKAVVGSGGGVSERADFAHNLQPNGSPQQILQGVGTIKELLGGRLSEVERTYSRSTGRGDFRNSFLSPAAQKILAARTAADGGGVPPDIAAILQKHGGK